MFPVFPGTECGIHGCLWKRSVPEAAAVPAAGNGKADRLRAASVADIRDVVRDIVRVVRIPAAWAGILQENLLFPVERVEKQVPLSWLPAVPNNLRDVQITAA